MPYDPVDRWTLLFEKLDELLLLKPGMESIWPAAERNDFMLLVQGPCHADAYEWGLTSYRPICKLGPEDFVDDEGPSSCSIRAISGGNERLH